MLSLYLLRLLIMPILASSFVTQVPPALSKSQITTSSSSSTLLRDSENPFEGAPLRSLQKFQKEETLLWINLKPMHDTPLESVVLPRLQKYIQQFHFSGVLPVQNLQAKPTVDGGVELIFWRPTDQSHEDADGGMRFFIVPSDDDFYNKNDDKSLQIIVKRQSKGQTCRKSTTEKLVIQAFVQAFVGKDRDKTYSSQDPPTYDVVTMESVFHKWMFSS